LDSLCSGSAGNLKSRVGIITPYKAQVKLLKSLILPWLRQVFPSQKSSSTLSALVEINTVDAYQGREKDIIIINCVRSNKLTEPKTSLGFLTDYRRMNVAITRARHFLFVIGNGETLKRDKEIWAQFVESAEKGVEGWKYHK
jgi:superfamily I DNA and/or RNA helicase